MAASRGDAHRDQDVRHYCLVGYKEAMVNTESMTDAVSKAIAWGVAHDDADGRCIVWILSDGTFTIGNGTASAPTDGALAAVRVGDLDELLGPTWDTGLDRDDAGRPVMTEEQAHKWAAAWVSENGARHIDDAMEEGW